MAFMRLDRYIAQSTGLTRAQARKVITCKRVKVAGEVQRKASFSVADCLEVSLDDQPLKLRQHIYLMLNKPQGVVCATEDEEHTTVVDLIPEELLDQAKGLVHPAGRLDIDTTGLVLLTDDGLWSHTVTSPRKGCGKRYQVTLAEPLAEGGEQRLSEGLLLKGEDKETLPAHLQIQSPTELVIEISEGRYHQVKRMFAAVGNKVVSLHRLQIGPIHLDPELLEGESRLLSEDEIGHFRRTK
ncbi:MAG: pseudouridine synthase [Motiliproteus sp.]